MENLDLDIKKRMLRAYAGRELKKGAKFRPVVESLHFPHFKVNNFFKLCAQGSNLALISVNETKAKNTF